MATPQTIQELTGSQYNELYYNTAGKAISGSFMNIVCNTLDKCGMNVKGTTTYDQNIESAVAKFQGQFGLTANGILNNATWQTMLLYAKRQSDIVNEDSEYTVDSYGEKSTSPHFNSFFNGDNFKTPRRNRQDIKIVFGNNTIKKTLKNVYMRSLNVEVDTSGNPISETYEFIARDVVESDEINDTGKYLSDEHYSSSDIQYIYNFGKTN